MTHLKLDQQQDFFILIQMTTNTVRDLGLLDGKDKYSRIKYMQLLENSSDAH
jgi:hypothetical protein